MNRSLWVIFRWPLFLGLISIVGLVAALVGDGLWDVLSWITLGIPALWFSYLSLRPFFRTDKPRH